MAKPHIMVINRLHTALSQKAFIFGGLFLALIYFIGASGGIYLFDNSIVYYYGYLLSIGYKPFTDFSTPLLPLIGLLQSFSFKIFGFNYYSGVYMAFVLLIAEYIFLYRIIKKIIHKINLSAAFAFLASLGSIAFTSNLYYNHIIFSLVTLWLFLTYYTLVFAKDRFVFKLASFIIIIFVFFIKFHFGLVLICLQLINELIFRKSFNIKILLKYLVAYFILFITIGYSILLFSNNASFSDFLVNLEAISDKFSVRDNINFEAVSRLLLNVPRDLFSLIEINPFSLSLILLAPLALKFKSLEKIGLELFLVLEVLIISIIFVFNTFEALSILFPFQIVILLLFYFAYKNSNIPKSSIYIIYSFLFLHFLFSFFYVINGNRKSYNELNGVFLRSSFSIVRNELINPKMDHLKSNRIKSFFSGLSLTNLQITSFDYIDFLMVNYGSKRVYFGPELEIFNVIYEIEPFKGFPLWVHPGLSVSRSMNLNLSKKFVEESPELIFISSIRQGFLEFLEHENLLNHGYVLQNSASSDNFIICYVRKDLLNPNLRFNVDSSNFH